MLERIKKKTKVKGSALFSSILVLITTLLFIKMYQDISDDAVQAAAAFVDADQFIQKLPDTF